MVELYIRDKKVDLPKDFNLSLVYSGQNSESPSEYYNVFSKTISLPGTSKNNEIFGSLFDPQTILSVFDTHKRNKFELYINNILYQSGYVELIKINNNYPNITYNITLYGTLGDFFQSLKTNEDGTPKTLSDLYWHWIPVINGNEPEINLFDTYTKTSEDNNTVLRFSSFIMVDAFKHLESLNQEQPLDHYITRDIQLLPKLLGTPSDNFEPNKILFNTLSRNYYFENIREKYNELLPEQITIDNQDFKPYSDYDKDKNIIRSWAKIEATRNLNPAEIRAYPTKYQDLGLRVKSLLQTISYPENNGGFTINWNGLLDTPEINYLFINLGNFTPEAATQHYISPLVTGTNENQIFSSISKFQTIPQQSNYSVTLHNNINLSQYNNPILSVEFNSIQNFKHLLGAQTVVSHKMNYTPQITHRGGDDINWGVNVSENIPNVPSTVGWGQRTSLFSSLGIINGFPTYEWHDNFAQWQLVNYYKDSKRELWSTELNLFIVQDGTEVKNIYYTNIFHGVKNPASGQITKYQTIGTDAIGNTIIPEATCNTLIEQFIKNKFNNQNLSVIKSKTSNTEMFVNHLNNPHTSNPAAYFFDYTKDFNNIEHIGNWEKRGWNIQYNTNYESTLFKLLIPIPNSTNINISYEKTNVVIIKDAEGNTYIKECGLNKDVVLINTDTPDTHTLGSGLINKTQADDPTDNFIYGFLRYYTITKKTTMAYNDSWTRNRRQTSGRDLNAPLTLEEMNDWGHILDQDDPNYDPTDNGLMDYRCLRRNYYFIFKDKDNKPISVKTIDKKDVYGGYGYNFLYTQVDEIQPYSVVILETDPDNYIFTDVMGRTEYIDINNNFDTYFNTSDQNFGTYVGRNRNITYGGAQHRYSISGDTAGIIYKTTDPKNYVIQVQFNNTYRQQYSIINAGKASISDSESNDNPYIPDLTKKSIFYKTNSPYDYLIAFSKLFNWRFEYDINTNEVNVIKNSDYYNYTSNLEIDYKSIEIQPISIRKKYIDIKHKIPVVYPIQLRNEQTTFDVINFDTKYEINSDTYDLFNNSIFTTGDEYTLKSPYFRENMMAYPAPLCNTDYKYTLFSFKNPDGSISTEQTDFVEGNTQQIWTNTSMINELSDYRITDLIAGFDASDKYVESLNQLTYFDGWVQNYSVVNNNLSGGNFCNLEPYVKYFDIFPTMMKLNDNKECYIYDRLGSATTAGYINPNNLVNAPFYLPKFSTFLTNTENNILDNYISIYNEDKLSKTIVRSLNTTIDEQFIPETGPQTKFMLELDNPSSITDNYNIEQKYVEGNYSKYWKTNIEQMYDKNVFKITANVKINNPRQDLKTVFYFKNANWVIEKIHNYNPINNPNWCKVTLRRL